MTITAPAAVTPVVDRLSTRFLDAADVATLVRRKGLQNCLREVAETIRDDFMRWPDFDKCPRVAAHSPDGVIELMPVADSRNYSFKYVNGHPRNFRHRLPTVMAFGVLADVATGAPLLLSDLTLATAIRTAATSALAACALARPESRVMALIGNGAQSEFQALAFQRLLGIEAVRLHDIDPQATRKLVRNLEGSGLEVAICASAAEAARGADIVTTATADKTNATIITPDMIAPGMHLNAVGGDCPGKTELHAEVLRGADVFVEYTPQSRIEGDVQQLPEDFPVTELWEVLSFRKPGRRDPRQVTVFDSVGFALEDFSMLRYLHAVALELDLGQDVGLVPDQADPKDLFGTIGARARAVERPASAIAA